MVVGLAELRGKNAVRKYWLVRGPGRSGVLRTIGQVTVMVVLVWSAVSGTALAESPGWKNAKNVADDMVYRDHHRSFYCGCITTSDNDDNGSGSVNLVECGYSGPEKHSGAAERIDWEHIVPASLMPARLFDCWRNGDREHCERVDSLAKAMLFDLHNLVPAIGQVNRLRLNDRYAELPKKTSDFGECEIEDTRGFFEPPDCHKGDVARVWLYMAERYGVMISPPEQIMFEKWSMMDPVSPWEAERERRITEISCVPNHFVREIAPEERGRCPWE